MTIERLLDLQRLDLEIDRLETEARVYPDKLAEVRSREAAKKQAVEEARGRMNQLEAERRDLDGTLKLEEERLKKSKRKINELRKDYEIRAMQREIELTKRSNAELEERILSKMEAVEEAAKIVAQCEAEWSGVGEELARLAPEVRDRSAEFEGRLSRKHAERESVAGQIEAPILSRYRRIREYKHRDAVAAVVSYRCQGCYMNVPPQMVNEILRKKTIGSCPNCFRLLYIEPSRAG